MPDFKLADSICHQLRRVEQLASDRFTKLVGENGLTLRQFEVLTAISENPGLSQSDLVDITGVDRSTLADMMTRLQKRGWVERSQSSADARANAVRLTASGLSTVVAAIPHARAADALITDTLGKKTKAFQTALHKLVKKADQANAAALRKAQRAEKKRVKAEAKAAATLAGEGQAKKHKRKKKDTPPAANLERPA
jgi:DNA-binding MarR family transcriptional regulator